MIDFRIVQAKTVLPVTTVAPIREFLPISILVVGQQLTKTDEVFYNDVVVDEFYAQSDTRLIVRVPKSQLGRNFESIKVLSSVQLINMDAEVSLQLSKPIRKVSGIDRLVQAWMMIFLTTPGSDAFDQSSGGGGRALIGSNADNGQGSTTASLVMAIDRTKKELIRLQASTPNIPPAERLLSSSLVSSNFNSETTVISATVSIQNAVGDLAEVSLG